MPGATHKFVVSGRLRNFGELVSVEVCIVVEAPDIREALDQVDTRWYRMELWEAIEIRRVTGWDVREVRGMGVVLRSE